MKIRTSEGVFQLRSNSPCYGQRAQHVAKYVAEKMALRKHRANGGQASIASAHQETVDLPFAPSRKADRYYQVTLARLSSNGKPVVVGNEWIWVYDFEEEYNGARPG